MAFYEKGDTETPKRQRGKKALWRPRQTVELSNHKPRNAWNHQKLEEVKKNSFLEPSGGAWPSWHLACRLLVSRTVREQISVILSPLFVALRYGVPKEINTHTILFSLFQSNSGTTSPPILCCKFPVWNTQLGFCSAAVQTEILPLLSNFQYLVFWSKR